MGKIIKEDFADYSDKLMTLEKKLTNLGYKFTGQRKIVLQALGSDNKLFDADTIFMEVKKIDPSVGISTVYRALELLSRLKLICRISVGTDKSMYMLSDNCRKDTSVYMVCDNCKRIITNNECLNSAIIIRLREGAEKNIFKNCKLMIDKFQIVFSGLCEDCSKSSDSLASSNSYQTETKQK